MHCVVADHAERVERLLHSKIESVGNEFPDVLVEVLAVSAEVGHELLECEAEKGAGAPRGAVGDRGRLAIVGLDIGGHFRVRRWRGRGLWKDDSAVTGARL